jgi:hypothetical protein
LLYRVGWAASRKNPIKSAATPHDAAATVYVRFMALSNDAVVSEESLRDLFNNFGPVFDCAIKKLCKDPVSVLFAELLLTTPYGC